MSGRGPGPWSCVESALRWYFAFHATRLRGLPLPEDRYGCQIDGSPPVYDDGALVVAATIGAALARVAEDTDPRWGASGRSHALLVATYQDGRSQVELSRELGVAQSTVSRWLGQAEACLVGPLQAAGIVEGARLEDFSPKGLARA
jgi:hypothetical protein